MKKRSKKKWELPKTIDIGGRVFKIKRFKTQPRDVKNELGEVSGWCDWCGGILGIVEKHGADPLVLFHEIGHAAAYSVKARNPLSNESFARPFFAVFYSALKNANLVK